MHVARVLRLASIFMTSRTLTGGIIVGVALLAAALSYVVFSAGSDAVISAPTSSSSTAPDAPQEPDIFYVSPNEIPLGPSVLVPTSVDVSGRRVSIEYDLQQLAPIEGLPAGFAFVPFQGFQELTPADAETVFPTAWTLVVDGTEVPGTVANPNARAARFDIPDGVTASRLESARIDSYHIQIPLDQPFTLSPSSPSHEIVPGITASLAQVSEQSSTTIVRVQVTVSDPLTLGGIDINARGEGAIVSVREAEGGPVWNLTYAGKPGEEFSMSLVGSMWFEIPGPWPVDLEVDDG